jgi:hypothetical protein
MAMNHRVFGVSSVFALSLFVCSAEASTVTVDDATWGGGLTAAGIGPPDPATGYYGGCCASNQVAITGPGTYSTSFTTAYGGSSSVTATLSGEPFPALTTSGTGTVGAWSDAADALSGANLSYYISIVGPSGLVPIDFTARGTLAQSYATGSASTQLYIEGDIDDQLSVDIWGQQSISLSGDQNPLTGSANAFTLSGTTEEAANTQILVGMSIGINVETNGPYPTGSASAYLDPIFYIDPTFPDASEYSIVISPGIGNSPVSGVPEPSTWAMMLLGVAGLGFAGYRNVRRKIAIAA